MTTQQRYKICIVLLVIALIGAISATLIMKSKKKPQVAKDPVEMESAEIRNYFDLAFAVFRHLWVDEVGA